MRTYQWAEPTSEIDSTPSYFTITDHEILLIHWLWWSNEVFRVRPDNTFNITPERCIEDFVAIHWAEEV